MYTVKYKYILSNHHMVHKLLKVNGKVTCVGLNSSKLKYIRKQVSSKPADTCTCARCVVVEIYLEKNYNLDGDRIYSIADQWSTERTLIDANIHHFKNKMWHEKFTVIPRIKIPIIRLFCSV